MRGARTSRPRGARRGLVAIVAMLASIVILAQPASAATRCLVADNGDQIVHLDERNGAITDLAVRNGRLEVNGDDCGPVGASIAIVDDGDAKLDRVRINLAAGAWRVGNEAIFVNLILEGDGDGGKDEVIIRGTNGVDHALAFGNFVVVARENPFPGAGGDSRRLFMWTELSLSGPPLNPVQNAEYEFQLRGGADTFVIRAGDSGAWWNQSVTVKGGKGDDQLIGGPGRQKLYGGSGDDVIEGKTGNDRLKGNSGNDVLRGNKGNDYLHGGAGNDDLFGSSGSDEIIGGPGRDDVTAGSGADEIKLADGERDKKSSGGKGADTCECDPNDRISSTRKI